MYKKFMGTLRLLNLLFQAIYTLALPIGISVLISHLVTKHLSWPRWVWALFITVGTLLGLVAMIRYILAEINNMERFEQQKEAERAKAMEKTRKQEDLLKEFKHNESEDRTDE